MIPVEDKKIPSLAGEGKVRGLNLDAPAQGFCHGVNFDAARRLVGEVYSARQQRTIDIVRRTIKLAITRASSMTLAPTPQAGSQLTQKMMHSFSSSCAMREICRYASSINIIILLLPIKVKHNYRKCEKINKKIDKSACKSQKCGIIELLKLFYRRKYCVVSVFE